MVPPTSPNLVDVLRSTLDRLEKSEELASDDPALTELKESILSNITELEVAKTPKPPAAPKRILWISPKPRPQEQKDSVEDQHQEQPSQDGPAVTEPSQPRPR